MGIAATSGESDAFLWTTEQDGDENQKSDDEDDDDATATIGANAVGGGK